MFTKQDEARIFSLVEKLIGTKRIADQQSRLFLTNVTRRMQARASKDLDTYLTLAKSDPIEHQQLISALTIHTTYWFRESRHFDVATKHLEDQIGVKPVNVLSVGCSTGEEVYSLALCLEQLRQRHAGFDYKILGVDIDPVSIEKAKQAVYPSKNLDRIPKDYHRSVLLGSGQTEGLLTLSKDIRSRCNFKAASALNLSSDMLGQFDLALCRNMLIYFAESEIRSIARRLAGLVKTDGLVILGHSENLDGVSDQFQKHAGSVYQVKGSSNRNTLTSNTTSRTAKSLVLPEKDVLIVDDSATMRRTIAKVLDGDKLSYAEASSAEEAGDLLRKTNFRMIALDLNLPGENGDEWLRKVRSQGIKTPCVIVSGIATDDRDRVLHSVSQMADDFFGKERFAKEHSRFLARVRTFVKAKKTLDRLPKSPVVVVDDDQDVREILTQSIKSMGFEAMEFDSAQAAIEGTKNKSITAIVTDYQMPGMHGTEFAKKIAQGKHYPVILVSGYVVDLKKDDPEGVVYRFLDKPIDFAVLNASIRDGIVAGYNGELSAPPTTALPPELLLIGASTGGPQALHKILSSLSFGCPPTIIVQHMQTEFQAAFAEKIARDAGVNLVTVDKATKLEPNTFYLARPDHHIDVQSNGGSLIVSANSQPHFKGHRPCVEYLFKSAAKIKNKRIAAILLTGMGYDGAEGMLELRQAGACTIAQNMASSVVFGMPRAAIDLGAAEFVADLDQIEVFLRDISAKTRQAA